MNVPLATHWQDYEEIIGDMTNHEVHDAFLDEVGAP